MDCCTACKNWLLEAVCWFWPELYMKASILASIEAEGPSKAIKQPWEISCTESSLQSLGSRSFPVSEGPRIGDWKLRRFPASSLPWQSPLSRRIQARSNGFGKSYATCWMPPFTTAVATTGVAACKRKSGPELRGSLGTRNLDGLFLDWSRTIFGGHSHGWRLTIFSWKLELKGFETRSFQFWPPFVIQTPFS